ncbi:hypothetical protein IAR55_001811 [Kwoniella newhampshirensis]|uniref:Amidohydrolase-related domain-containing protein n=1 Tax=Kwoniella newhampshirensis TaxID=1651941 RepID=A0AAW0Z379_9TREE
MMSPNEDALNWKTTHWLPYPLPADYTVVNDPWIRPEQVPTSFVGVNVVDVEGETVLKNMTVKIRKGKFESIAPTGDNDIADEKHMVVDATGLFMCPGLIDCHAHVTAVPVKSEGLSFLHDNETALKSTWVLRGMLLRGFTTARDVGGATRHYKDATENWVIPGPRLFICGGPLLSQTGGHGDISGRDDPLPCSCSRQRGESMGWTADGVDECLKKARKLMMMGADHIKIAASGGVLSDTETLTATQFTIPEMKAIVQTVDQMEGTMVTAHCFTTKAARAAIEAGVRGIEHGSLIDIPTLKLMAEKGVFLTPTLIVSDAIARPPYDKMTTPYQHEKVQHVVKESYEMLKNAHEAGVCIGYGTDCFGILHPNQLAEFDLRKKVLPSPAILKQATINAAKMLRMEGKLGIIKLGAFADFLLLSASPLEDVGILNRPRQHFKGILKDGRCVFSRLSGLPVEVSIE